MLDLRRLDVLQRFATLGSITAVAADLGYSASAVSQQLSVLEREAGIALIERTARSASLTEAGRELAEQAGVILGAVEEAEARMFARTGTVAGRIVLSCIPGLAVALAPHLAQVQREHPDLSVVAHETTSTQAATDVLERRSDLAVVDDWDPEPATMASGLIVLQLRREEIVLAVPTGHPLADRRTPLSAAALREVAATETWLSAPHGQLSRSGGDARLASIDAEPQRRWEFEGLDVQAALIAAGTGVALLPTGVVERNGLAAVSLAPRMQRRIVALTRTTLQHDPPIEACLRAVHRAVTGR